jgi:hypothetical protein
VSEDRRTQGGGLSVKTLLIAGAASAIAAIVIPVIWRPGTVFAAAMTPVVVALVSELLRKPVETVSTVRVLRVARGNVPLGARREDAPFDPLAPPPTEELELLPEATAPRRTTQPRPRLTPRQWKLALVTGLIAFAAVVVLFTASELLAGDSVSGGGKRTTFFSGSSSKQDTSASDAAKDKEKDKQKESDAKQSVTPTPEPTETPAPSTTPTPTPTPGATPSPAATTQQAVPTPTP